MKSTWRISRKMHNLYNKYKTDKFPTTVNIELTTLCNLNCRMCGHSSSSFKSGKNPNISMEAIERVLPIAQKAGYVWLSGYGEPLMHPQIFEIIHKMKQINPLNEVAFTSNAVLLDDERIERLVRSGLTTIQVSFDGYGTRLGHQRPEKIMENIKKIHKIQNWHKLISSFPYS